MATITPLFDHDLYPGDLCALEFIRAVTAEEGDATYGDATAVGSMSFPTSSTLSNMVDEAQAFWETGIRNATGTTAITGFSATTPREFYDGYPGLGTIGAVIDPGTGAWVYSTGTSVTGRNFALAVRGWFGQFGYDTRVQAVFEWLMAFTSNADFEHSDDEITEQHFYDARTGDFDPKICLAALMDTSSQENGSTEYDWACVGLMSEVLSAYQLAKFADAKRAAARPRRRRYRAKDDKQALSPSIRGKSGLAFQIGTAETLTVDGASYTSRIALDVVRMAQFGLAYRENPVIYQVSENHR